MQGDCGEVWLKKRACQIRWRGVRNKGRTCVRVDVKEMVFYI